MRINSIKHVFFDLDHTLWDFDRNSGLTFDKVFQKHGIELSVSLFLEVYETVNFSYWKRYRNDEIDQIELRYGRLRDTFKDLDFSVDENMIHHLSVDYLEHLSSFNHLFDGALDLLHYLQPKYQLHIITNGFEASQLKKMDGSAITSYFRTITHADVAGVKKPNRIIFDHALDVAQARPEESIMIGDSYEADILGALNAGYDAVFFNYRNERSDPHIKQIKHLSELKKYL